LTYRHKKLHERQKDLQNKINAKISNDIHNVQQVLEALIKQNQSQRQETDLIQCNDTIQEIDGKEKQEQVNSNITNVKENKEVIDYKTKTDWYASLLMYNSY
jgi:transcriptional accessory protein Tex/SPT6